MKKLWQNCKGMVTVMVTLLLIPSLLVTGSAVDIARIYAAKSVLQDANQLAANSTLTSYDALLQDLYGLYGIMASDSELAEMINEYIEISVLGQDGQGKGLGTFQLLYGSELKPGTITPASGQNLGNTEVLRRQIEEYSKFRVPVVLVDELLDRLNGFEKVQKDADVIEDKMDLDDGLEDLTKIYEKVYEKINEVNTYGGKLKEAYDQINVTLDEIHAQLDEMLKVRGYYTEHVEKQNDSDLPEKDRAHWKDRADEDEERYEVLADNIDALINGGKVWKNWVQGTWEDEEEGTWSPGYFRDYTTKNPGLAKQVSNARKICNDGLKALDELVELGKKADEKKEELKRKLDTLESKLSSCSDGLRDSLNTPTEGNQNRSALEVYRDALKYDIEPMARVVSGQNAPMLQGAKNFLDNPVYGDWKPPAVATTIQLTVLEHLKSANGFEIDLEYYNKTHTSKLTDRLSDVCKIGASLFHYQYNYSGEFLPFQHISFETTGNPEFYELLQGMFDGDSKAKKSTAKKAATKIFAEAQDMFQGLTNYEPEGAWKYTPSSGGGAEAPEENFGQDGDWSKEGVGKDKAKEALSGSLVQRLGSIADKSANHLLLLGYDSEMFSCFTTNKGLETGRKTMAGIPLGIDVNYFYQSELEFLYAGSYNAQDNLKSVAGMIFLVRFVFNYIASFQIDEINNMVNAVKKALSTIAGPFAFVIGELVRVGYALGESALDVGRLRQGYTVKLFKDEKTWRFSISGLINSTEDGLSEDLSFSEKNNSSLNDEGLDAFCYRDYLRVFLLLKSDTDLAQGTQKLIELNMTNYQNGIGGKGDHTAREAAMSSVDLVDLSKAVTGFTLTTEVNLRMLFLSMPVAQRGVNGVVPPGSVPISVTDYRGY